MTHPQALSWELWLLGDPQDRVEAGKREADARIKAAKADPNAVTVKRSENRPGLAAELLARRSKEAAEKARKGR